MTFLGKNAVILAFSVFFIPTTHANELEDKLSNKFNYENGKYIGGESSQQAYMTVNLLVQDGKCRLNMFNKYSEGVYPEPWDASGTADNAFCKAELGPYKFCTLAKTPKVDPHNSEKFDVELGMSSKGWSVSLSSYTKKRQAAKVICII